MSGAQAARATRAVSETTSSRAVTGSPFKGGLFKEGKLFMPSISKPSPHREHDAVVYVRQRRVAGGARRVEITRTDPVILIEKVARAHIATKGVGILADVLEFVNGEATTGIDQQIISGKPTNPGLDLRHDGVAVRNAARDDAVL